MPYKKIKQNAFSIAVTEVYKFDNFTLILHFYAKFYNRFKSPVHLSSIFVHLSKNLKIFDGWRSITHWSLRRQLGNVCDGFLIRSRYCGYIYVSVCQNCGLSVVLLNEYISVRPVGGWPLWFNWFWLVINLWTNIYAYLWVYWAKVRQLQQEIRLQT